MPVLIVTDTVQIDEAELLESFVRASGPGGQNVNKVSSAVMLKFDVKSSPSLPEWLRLRLLEKRDRRLTTEGVLVISGQRFRTQDRNRSDVRERLMQWVRDATVMVAPRIATKPSRASQRRRVESKTERGAVKRLRSRPGSDD